MDARRDDERARIRAALESVLAGLAGHAPEDAVDAAEVRALAAALHDTVHSQPEVDDDGPATSIRRLVHDMRSVSGTLLTWAHLLRRGGLSEEQLAHGVAAIERAAQRQVVLAEQLASACGGAAPAGVAAEPDLHGLRILIVDDDADARDAMRTILAACGADVATAVSAIDAFDVLQQGRPDLLISDIVMPDADGYALLRRVRAPDTGERGLIPAIAVTGHAYPADRQRALGAGYQLHLTKPLAPSDLLQAVRTVTGR